MSYCFMFPGQGSQFVGMGKDLAENFSTAKLVFDEVDNALSQNLFGLMSDGSLEELTLTSNAQPALMAVSMAIVKVLEKDFDFSLKDHAKYVAGHSLGEYSAACASGVFSISDTAKLLRIRGDAMQKAMPIGVGGMAAVLGIDIEKVQDLAKACSTSQYFCAVANDNCEGQVVISGHMPAIDKAVELASSFGAKRCIKLPVSAPFHSSLMLPAQEKMAIALHDVVSHQPQIPLVCNVLARALNDKEAIIKNLISQVTGSVLWRDSVCYMAQNGITNMVELGAGKVLSGLVKKCDNNINAISVGTPADIEQFIKEIKNV